MSRIGKKPIAIPKGVTVKIEGNTVMVQGPKGKLDTSLPSGIKMEQKDGNLVAIRPDDAHAGGPWTGARAGQQRRRRRDQGLDRELEIVGIGYRAEMKGKGTVIFSLGTRIRSNILCPRRRLRRRCKADSPDVERNRPAESRPGGGGNALAASARSVQEQGRALHGRAVEEEGWQDGSEMIAFGGALRQLAQ